MTSLLGLLPLVFGAVAIVVYARAKRPIARSLGLNVSRWSPLEVVIGLTITFVAIGLTLVAAVGTGLGGVMYGVAFLGTRSVWLPLGLLARFVVIGPVVLYLWRRWPDGRLTTLTYAPEPVRRRGA